MKASELISHLKQFGETAGGYECWDHELMRESATMLERYLALADELEAESTNVNIGNVGYKQGVASAANRLRDIGEGGS